MEKVAIAPSGARLNGLGIWSLASALPRHMRPSGILPPPIKFAVSNMTLRGGSPSGAILMWTCEPVGGVRNSALRVGTVAITTPTAMLTVGGVASETIKAQVAINARLKPVDFGPFGGRLLLTGDGEGGLMCIGKFWTTVATSSASVSELCFGCLVPFVASLSLSKEVWRTRDGGRGEPL
jgi:hypothetical protein